MKGAIAEISGAKAIMLTEDGEFVAIKNKKYSVGQRVVVAKQNDSRFSAIAAGFLLAFVLGGGSVWGYYTPVSHVDIDINPSIRLKLNILDHVIGVTPLNDDGEVFLENVGSLPENVDECVSEMTKQAIEQGYIHEDNNEIYIYAVTSRAELSHRMNDFLQDANDEQGVIIHAETESETTLKTAKRHDVSVGRIKLLEEFSDVVGGTIDENVKVFRGKPNKEIRAAIGERKKHEAPPEQGTDVKPKEHSGNGNDIYKQPDAEYEKPENKALDAFSDKQKDRLPAKQPEKSADTPADRPEMTEVPENMPDMNAGSEQSRPPELTRELPADSIEKGMAEGQMHENTAPDRNAEIQEEIERNREINTEPQTT